MSAGEALVFWLGGFSSDPKYPISGEGGPSYRQSGECINVPAANDASSIRSTVANGCFPLKLPGCSRARPTTSSTNRTTASSSTKSIPGQNGQSPDSPHQFLAVRAGQVGATVFVFRRVAPSGGRDGWRRSVGTFDPPAATALNPNALHVHAIKTRSESADATVRRSSLPTRTNSKSCTPASMTNGATMSSRRCRCMTSTRIDPNDYLLYPDGPFTGDVADTITNFSEGTLEASQP